MKTVVALDSSGKTAGVCVLQDGSILYEKTLTEGLTHSETLLPLLETALASCGLSSGDVTLYAVTAGPGSFTGLRIGAALVKGLALPFGTPVVPVSTLEALAMAISFDGVVVPALDARRGEVYWAAFDRRNGCLRLASDTVGPAADIAECLAGTAAPIFFVGDGAEICYNMFTYGQAGVSAGKATLAPAAPPPPIARGAALVAAAQQNAGNLPSAAALRPVYLRLSQAEREKAARDALRDGTAR